MENKINSGEMGLKIRAGLRKTGALLNQWLTENAIKSLPYAKNLTIVEKKHTHEKT